MTKDETPRPIMTREQWRERSVRDNTDMSYLLRQRIRVLDWVRAGRPPLAEWLKRRRDEDDVSGS